MIVNNLIYCETYLIFYLKMYYIILKCAVLIILINEKKPVNCFNKNNPNIDLNL